MLIVLFIALALSAIGMLMWSNQLYDAQEGDRSVRVLGWAIVLGVAAYYTFGAL